MTALVALLLFAPHPPFAPCVPGTGRGAVEIVVTGPAVADTQGRVVPPLPMGARMEIEGAFVALHAGGNVVVAEAHTDEKGRACLLLPPGTYGLAVSAARLERFERVVKVRNGKRTRVPVEMELLPPRKSPTPRERTSLPFRNSATAPAPPPT